METLWIEFVPDIGAVRIYCREPEKFAVETRSDRLIASCGDQTIEFPISSDVFVSPKETIGDVAVVSVKISNISVNDVSKFFSNSTDLYEDWSKVDYLSCRNCFHAINSIDFADLTPCLLPSATWGFEDMRVCEECGPLVVGDIRSHRHDKKSKRKNFFVDTDKVFVELEVDEVRCGQCDIVLGTNKLSSIDKLKAVVSDVSKMIEFEKKNLIGPKFLEAYNEHIDEISSIVDFVMDENDSKISPPQFDAKKIRILTRRRDGLIVIPGSTGVPVWGIRIMYHDNSLVTNLEAHLDRFSTPSVLKKEWKSAILAPISPIIVEM